MQAEGSSGSARTTLVRSVLRGAFQTLIAVLAFLGLLALIDHVSWGAKIWEFIASDQQSKWPDRIEFYTKYGALIFASFVLYRALTKAELVVQIFNGYNEAKAPIYTMGKTMAEVEDTAKTLNKLTTKLSGIQPLFHSTAQKIEDAVNQLADMDRLKVSEEIAEPDLSASATAPDESSDPERGWELLRGYWNANGQRLDEVRSRIKEKRKRDRFMRMPRTNYKDIINQLADEKLITETARKGSLDLHTTFMANRRFRNPSPETVANMQVLDALLEHEFNVAADFEVETAPPEQSPVVHDVNTTSAVESRSIPVA